MSQGFTQIVDYAGLFPPAACGMDEAVRHYAEYRQGDDRWMLGRFVVPATRLVEFGAALVAPGVPGAPADRWPLSVLLGEDALEGVRLLRAFEASHGARAAVVAVEARAATPAQVAALAATLPTAVERFVEVPHATDYRVILEAIHAAGMAAKLRTGGVLPQHFPTAHQVRRFLEDAVAIGVQFKATAGLHHPFGGIHPLTYEPDSPRHPMFGFVNVLLATALLRAGLAGDEVEALLVDDDPAAFGHDEAGWTWRGHHVGQADLEVARGLGFRGFGSCSFREPVDELALEGRPA